MKKQKSLQKKEIEEFREKLLQVRIGLLGEIRALEKESLGESPRDSAGDLSGYGHHMPDVGTDNYQRDVDLNLRSSEEVLLREVEKAVRRCDEGTFGECESCNRKIAKERLKVVPYTRFCVRCEEMQEENEKRERKAG